jgi:3-oxoacyl-(acyl-carrier-protein) synthase
MSLAAVLALTGAATAAGGAGSVVWERPEAAQARSAATGVPIVYFFTQNGALKEGGS